MATARQLSKDGAWDLVVAEDGSSEGDGDGKRVSHMHSGKGHVLNRWSGSRRNGCKGYGPYGAKHWGSLPTP
eukprot:4825662-Prymnesium_polylepis.1